MDYYDVWFDFVVGCVLVGDIVVYWVYCWYGVGVGWCVVFYVCVCVDVFGVFCYVYWFGDGCKVYWYWFVDDFVEFGVVVCVDFCVGDVFWCVVFSY